MVASVQDPVEVEQERVVGVGDHGNRGPSGTAPSRPCRAMSSPSRASRAAIQAGCHGSLPSSVSGTTPPLPDRIAQLTAPPYDVISEPHRDGFHEASPYNVAHLDLAVGSLDPDHEESRYARAADLLASWQRSGVLRADEEPTYDAYELSWSDAADRPAGRIRGVFGGARPWSRGAGR